MEREFGERIEVREPLTKSRSTARTDPAISLDARNENRKQREHVYAKKRAGKKPRSF